MSEELIGRKCVSCGANLPISLLCEYCGTQNLIKDGNIIKAPPEPQPKPYVSPIESIRNGPHDTFIVKTKSGKQLTLTRELIEDCPLMVEQMILNANRI